MKRVSSVEVFSNINFVRFGADLMKKLSSVVGRIDSFIRKKTTEP
jgi:hypothetical protein